MSHIGKMPIEIPEGVEVKLENGVAWIKGPKGELSLTVHPQISVVRDGQQLKISLAVSDPEGVKQLSKFHGLTRTLLNNMVIGVKEGHEKKIEIIGVGYKAQLQGNTLVMNLGYSHPINYAIPVGISIVQDKENKNLLSINGVDKQLVGEVAAQIRRQRPPEPYKGKGIRYVGEKVRRKAGKSASK
ncbi:50S ribosomal protein L6 [Candidatus Peregrinibacteria bacterium CG08_land_8_20_14_0_20_41_10]|nr:MAG: 50S ribosomal protein L6 [Candidatus Peregrinibacteria bacterium CG1_02_41_10]PIS32210.1 MAG: 50S ribosomal protein L6 [Candidatus Peregrinibacteria bacterium CG08_land_8_20_14_0_20_41_10]